MANPFGSGGWTPERLGDLTGKTYVITGANSGIGFEASKVFARRGARLLWLCRNPAKMDEALAALRAEVPDADVTGIRCDLADLTTVRTAAEEVLAATDRIDASINNAGIMMVPDRQLTAQGFELQLGVNHLGHFVLDALLADVVEASRGRIVAVSSGAHKAGAMDFDDLMWERGYGAIKAYCRSKLANMLFVLEGNRRMEAAGKATRFYAAHPGYSATNLQTTGPSSLWGTLMTITNVVAQSAEHGGWPEVLAAADPEARPGVYYGPTGIAEARGPVGECQIAKVGKDAEAARRLWEVSEQLTETVWPGEAG